MARVNYKKNSYCCHCGVVKPIEIIRCDVCSFRVRHHGHNSKEPVWYPRNRERLMSMCHRRMEKGQVTFPVVMRRRRVKRMLAGLKPDIPVPQ